MKLHHLKHHQAYVNGLNVAEEAYTKTQSTKEKIALQAAIKFNGGGKCPLYTKLYVLPHFIHRPHQPFFVLDKSCPKWVRWR